MPKIFILFIRLRRILVQPCSFIHGICRWVVGCLSTGYPGWLGCPQKRQQLFAVFSWVESSTISLDLKSALLMAEALFLSLLVEFSMATMCGRIFAPQTARWHQRSSLASS